MKTSPRFVATLSGTLSLLTLAAAPVQGQVIVATSTSSAAALRPDSLKTESSARPAASSISSALASNDPVFQAGPIGVRPHFLYRAMYGTGIEAGPGNQHDSVIQSVSPGALFDIGKYWHLDYTPTWTFYSNEAFRDTAGQTAALSGRIPHAHGMIGAAVSYESSYAMLVETGRQTHQQTLATLVEGSYKIGQHSMLETSASRSARYANAVSDAPEWTTSDWIQWSSNNWFHYEFSPRLEAAVGVGVGYAEVGVGADMSYILPQAKFVWKPFDKLSLTAQAGEETRTFETAGHPRLKSPVYTASASYQLMPTTKLSFDATRAVSASYFANEITKSRGWTVGVEQRFIQRLYLAASLTSQSTAYLASRNNASIERDDRYRALNARLSTVMIHRLSLALLYQTGRNASDDAAYVFRSNQYGMELGLQF
jgi:hypothetical protein